MFTLLGTGFSEMACNSDVHEFHIFAAVSGTGLSHGVLAFQASCKMIFGTTVTGENSPSTS